MLTARSVLQSIKNNPGDIFEVCDMVMHVKEPQPSEYEFHPGRPEGKVCFKAVADDLGLDYTLVEEFLFQNNILFPLLLAKQLYIVS